MKCGCGASSHKECRSPRTKWSEEAQAWVKVCCDGRVTGKISK